MVEDMVNITMFFNYYVYASLSHPSLSEKMIVKYKYNSKGLVEEEIYHDMQGEPVATLVYEYK